MEGLDPSNRTIVIFVVFAIVAVQLHHGYSYVYLQFNFDLRDFQEMVENDLPNAYNVLSNSPTSARTDPLNVVILYPDDWRHDDLGDTTQILKTPFFSKLAKNGIRFTHNAVTTSICWISRATLFTGQWVSRHGSTFLFRPKFTNSGNWEKTWPYMLQQAGYYVGHVGKWQYHDIGEYRDKIFNFSDYFEGFFWGEDNTHISTMAKNSALEFLQKRPKDRPFALTVAFFPPKGSADPETAEPEFLKMYENLTIPEPYDRDRAFKLLPEFLQKNNTKARQRYNYRYVDPFDYQTSMRTYYAALSHIDKMCSIIVDELHKQKIYDKTLIIVTADNGEFHANHALADKWYPYQESIRVPLIIHDPRMSNSMRGTLDDSFTLNVDLATTILGAAGLKPAEEMQGRDIADLYTNRDAKPWRSEFYYEFPTTTERIPTSRALVRKEWKYIYWNEYSYEQLFNLKDDPFEFNDLAMNLDYADVKQEMKERLKKLRYEVMAPNVPETTCDPLWKPGTDFRINNVTNCSPERPEICCPVKKEARP